MPTTAEQERKHKAMRLTQRFLADMIDLTVSCVVVLYFREENGRGGYDVYAQVQANIPGPAAGYVLCEGVEAVKREADSFTPLEGLRSETN